MSGANIQSGDFRTPGILQPNFVQQDYFLDVAIPEFHDRDKSFMVIFWSRDPDGTQHNQGDSLNRLVPGINGPTSHAAIRNADHDLAGLLAALKAQGLDAMMNVIITADHGFSTISKESATSFAATQGYAYVVPKLLPPGFIAIGLVSRPGFGIVEQVTFQQQRRQQKPAYLGRQEA